MSLVNVVDKEEFHFIEEVKEISPELIKSAREKFNEYTKKGVILSGSFDDYKWELTNEVDHFLIDFDVNELDYALEKKEVLLGCDYEDCLQILHTYAVFRMNYSLKTVQKSVRFIVKYLNDFFIPNDLNACCAIMNFMELLPETTFTEDVIENIYDEIHYQYCNKWQNDPRKLKRYQSYFRFDHFLSIFWRECSVEERILYFPLWLWWNLTSIIPLRVIELILIPRDCIKTNKSERFLILRRTRLKSEKGTAHHTIADDYKEYEYLIPDSISDIILWYIEVTNKNYKSDIDSLFCVNTQYELLGRHNKYDQHYMPRHLKYLLSKFYADVLIEKHGFNIVNENTDILHEKEIEIIRLGDTRHIACIGIMVSGNDVQIVKELAGHQNIQTGANYYSSITKFMDAMLLEHVSINTNSNTHTSAINSEYISEVSQYEEITGGRCTSARFKKNDFSHCAAAVSSDGEIGKCECCAYFFPDSFTIYESKKKVENQLMVTCKILSEILMNRNDEIGMVSLRSTIEQLQAFEAQYFKISAIYRNYMEGI